MLRSILVLGCLFTTADLAGETEVKPFTVHAVTGEHAAQAIDYLAKRKAEPTVVLFVNAEQWSRPVARYLKVLDTELGKGIKGAESCRVVAVWLTDDANQSKEYLPKAQMSLDFMKTDLCVFEGPKAGPAGWNVDIAAQLTAIVIREGKEQARFDYRSTNDQDVPELLKALGKQK